MMGLKGINAILLHYLSGSGFDETQVIEKWLTETGIDNNEWTYMDEHSRKNWLSTLYDKVKETISSQAITPGP